MKALNFGEISVVSGGDGGAPATVANAAGEMAIIGAIAGIPGGPYGVVAGALIGGLGVAIGSMPAPPPPRVCRIERGYQVCF